MFFKGIVDCDIMRPFWLSWNDGLIVAGSGSEVGESILMSWTNPNPWPIVAASFGGYDNVPGRWRYSLSES